MNLLKEFSLNDNCAYLDDKEQTTHYKIIENCSATSCQEMVERGFRRFGKMFFRPICMTCQECQSIKIDVENFAFTKSKRRVLKKAQDIKIYIQEPSISSEHLVLFDKYHRHMHDKKDWPYQAVTYQHYYNSFVAGHNDFGYEVLYFDGDKLIGVDLIDVLEDGISSIYFYYDHDYSKYALGKLSLYKQVEFAKKNNKAWIYLGYYVKECPSLAYKADYKPYVTLDGRPQLYQEYRWN